MKRILVLGIAAMTSAAMWAAQPQLTVNGAPVEKAVTSLTFDGDNVVVHFGDDTAAYDMEAVEIVFKSTTSVNDLEMLAAVASVGDIVTVSGLADGTVAEVYNTSGNLVAHSVAAGGAAVIDLAGNAPGVYLLVAGNKCVKFVKH